MNNALPLLQFLHLLGVVVWVGGMFFAYVCLRPAAAALLESPQRLALWTAVFGRFFPWVWLAAAAILISGLAMLLRVGMRGAPIHWHIMLLTGMVMMLIFAHVIFAPFARLRAGVAASDWPGAAAALNQIRKLVGINLTLGLLTVVIAKLGPYLGY